MRFRGKDAWKGMVGFRDRDVWKGMVRFMSRDVWLGVSWDALFLDMHHGC